MGMKHIYIASDHAGPELKASVRAHLEKEGCKVSDLGPSLEEGRVDYPDYAGKLAEKVAQTGAEGILICGTGIGMSMAANKVPGIRAALAHDVFTATMAREHNNANVLVLGARVLEEPVALEMVSVWLNGTFEERHQHRLNKLHELEGEKTDS